MSSFGIGIDQALNHLGQTLKYFESLPQSLNTGKRVNAPIEDPTVGVGIHKGLSAFRRLQTINTRLNWVAMNVRAADQIMDTIGKYLVEMKAQLERIIKNFPPFPPGSEERLKILRSYNALRKQIDQMTFPPRDRGAMKIMADPAVLPKGGDPKTEAQDFQAFHLKNLNIPELPDMATDQEIAAAIESLNATQETLQEDRARLAMGALEVSLSEVVRHKWVEMDYDGEEGEFDLSEGTAELKSQELQRTLNTEMIKNLTEGPLQFVSLLK